MAAETYSRWKNPGNNGSDRAPSRVRKDDFGDLRKLTIADASAQVMRSRAGPVAIKELLPVLRSAGKLGNSKNGYNVVATILQRHSPSRFEKVSPGIWQLSNKLLSETPSPDPD